MLENNTAQSKKNDLLRAVISTCKSKYLAYV